MTEIIKKPELKIQSHLSPSSINTYYECPRQYFYNYIARMKIEPNIHMVKGSIVHKALETFFVKFPNNPEERMLELFNKSWQEYDQELKDLMLSEEKLKEAKEDALFMVMEYVHTYQRRAKGLKIAGKAESDSHAFYLLKPKFREQFIQVDDLHLRGYIDRVNEDWDGFVTLVDYKTSSKYGVALPEKYKRQLALYSLLYYHSEEELPDFVAVEFLRYGEAYFLEVTPSLLRYARDCLEYVYERTRSTDIDDYPLKEGKRCRWCPYHDICSGKVEWQKDISLEKMKARLKKKKDDKE